MGEGKGTQREVSFHTSFGIMYMYFAIMYV